MTRAYLELQRVRCDVPTQLVQARSDHLAVGGIFANAGICCALSDGMRIHMDMQFPLGNSLDMDLCFL